MNKRTLFFLSLASALLASGFHFASMSQIGHGVHLRAQAVTMSESERGAARAEAGRHSGRGVFLWRVGIAFAAVSVGFVVASARRKEPARRAVLILLLIFYGMLQLL